MNSQRVWNLVRVVVAVSLVLQSVASFVVMPVSAKVVAPVEARVIAEPSSVQTVAVQPAAPNAGPFVSPVVTPTATVEAIVTPETGKVAVPTGSFVVSETMKTLDAAGGQLTTVDKRIQLEVPAGVLDTTTQLSITPSVTKPDYEQSRKIVQFNLAAQNLKTGEKLLRLNQPVTLTIDLRGLIDRQQMQPYQRLVIFRGGEDSQTAWSELNNTTELSPGILQVNVNYFSTYAAGTTGNQPASWLLTYNPPVPSLFSGAMTFNYPIQVPAGRKGLEPNITLAYNSRSVDGVLKLESKDTDGLPPGWSLDLASISRNNVHYSCNPYCAIVFPDSFSLAINGTNHDIFPQTLGQAYGRYYTKDDPSLYIERHNDRGNNQGYNGSTQNQTHEYWIVKTGEGTTYRLGYRSDSEQIIGQDGFFGICDAYCGVLWDAQISAAASRWRVDTVTDVWGNQMTLNYSEYTTDDSGGAIWFAIHTQHIRPLNIDYNFNGTTSTSRVVLTNTDTTVNWINRIYVYNTSTSTKIREYRLDWSTDLKQVNAITEYDGGGTRSLPPTTFTHTSLPKDWWSTYFSPYITHIDNGYGGATTITYINDGRVNYCGAQAGCIPKQIFYGFSYRVQQTNTYDGLPANANNPAIVRYAYGQTCYDQADNEYGLGGPVQLCRTVPYAGVKSPLVGHASTSRQILALDGATIVYSDTHQFNIDDNNSPLRGRELQTQTFDGSPTPVHLTQVNNTYSTLIVAATTFTYLSQTDQTTYASGTSLTKRTTYAYDNYGNQTEQVEYDSGLQPYRRTLTGFNPNTSPWIVNKPAYTNIYKRIGNAWAPLDSPESSTWYTYDNQPHFSSPPVKGQLTGVRAWKGTKNPYTFVDTVYTYDTWGNRLTETTYDNDGDDNHYASLNPKTTTTAYDGVYHLYPTQVTNAKGQPTQYQYYGINESDSGTGSGPIGSLKRAIDPNGAATMYTYDAFGRLKTVIRPGDSLDNPTDRYQYYDGGDKQLTTPFQTDHLTRKAAGDWCTGGGIGGWERTIYDGLGRVVEQQSPMQDWTCTSGPIVLQYTLYNAQGQVAEQSVPYSVADAATGLSRYQAPDRSKPTTKTIYDALGRVTAVTNPDGTRTEHRYGLALDSDATVQYDDVMDANRHRKQSRYDAFGRLMRVYEFTGDCGDFGYTCAAPYTTLWASSTGSKYIYDVLGNLTDVFDAAQNQTHMTYNTLGQKTSMSDPDMGAWSYQYDNVGNLQKQTDAKGQVLWFNYDLLNRLVEKRQDGQSGPVLASYTYDQGANGIGRRTAMTDLSGSTNWSYDERGRVTNERKAIGDPQVLEAEGASLFHLYGNAQGGVWLSPAAPSYYSALTYGPYLAPAAIGPGQVASFRLAIDNASGANDVVALLDVFDSTTGQQLTTRAVYRREFNGGLDKFSDFALTFDTTGRSGDALEYRVLWYGTIQMAHDKTQVYWAPYSTGYAYDGMDRATSITYPTGEIVNQTYNFGPQLSSVVGTNNYASGMTYNPLGQLKQVTLGNGAVTSYAYYGDGSGAPAINSFRLWQVNTNKSGTNLLNLQYGYDNVGNVTSITDMVIGQTQGFQYDPLDRLLHAQATGGSNGTYSEDYAYTPIGNFMHKNNVAQTYNAQPVGTCSSGTLPAKPHAAASAGSNSYQYDCNGNMTQRIENSVTYAQAWNVENRPTAITNTTTGQVTQYFYDGDGNHVLRLNPDGTKTAYVDNLMEVTTITEADSLRVSGTGDTVSGVNLTSLGGLDWVLPNVDEKSGGTAIAFSGANQLYQDATYPTFIYADGGTYSGNQIRKAYYRYDSPTTSIAVPAGSGIVMLFLGTDVTEGATYRVTMGNVTTGDRPFAYRKRIAVSYTAVAARTIVVTLNRGTNSSAGVFAVAVQQLAGADSLAVSGTGDIVDGENLTSLGGLDWVLPNVDEKSGGTAIAFSGANQLYQDTTYPTFTYADGGTYSGNQSRRAYYRYDMPMTSITVPAGSGIVTLFLGTDVITGGATYRVTIGNVTTGNTPFAYRKKVTVNYTAAAARTIVVRLNRGSNSSAGVFAVAVQQLPIVRSYYFAGSQRVAMREATSSGSTVYYFAADHLGSTSVTMDASGTKIGEMKYYPFGETRYTWGGTPTDRRFTGQREENGLGSLYDYGARMYSPVLGRFISADTLVPSLSDPQQLNRYAYALNNPLRYIDPSGHAADAGGALCGSACWDAAYQNYLKYQQLADSAGDAYHGFLKEYASAQAAAYYNWSQQDAVQNLVYNDDKAAAAFGNLVRNGYYGRDAAVSAAFDAGAPGAALSFTLFGGVAPNMGENVPVGERLEYTAQSPLDAMKSSLSNDALVCRGGLCTAGRFENGTGVTVESDGTLSGVSVSSAPGKSVKDLSVTYLNKQVGVTTVGAIEAAGGTVTPWPTSNNPYHCVVCGLTPQMLETLFTPTIPNPNFP